MTETKQDTYLILVRHGATAYTENGQLCGGSDPIDPDLSANGLAQVKAATALVGKIGKQHFDWIPTPSALYSSPVRRAHQLGELLSAELGLAMKVDERAREIGVGEAFGANMAQLWEEYPGLAHRWISGEDLWAGLEPLNNMCDRLSDFTDELWAQHEGKTVVLACHEIVTRIILGQSLGWQPEQVMQLEIPLASTQILHRLPSGRVNLVAFGLAPSLGNLAD
ncbi:hypothetical protein BK816_05165 [Boudabousia tangfeifanii]|uniref:Histidine phosphatase family protein n=1 Tax=Boudabousia tangfeifanii TaxID=1912795 RepID=A0A1D9MKK3_9ACTO|nr:histidine phosphatase family protein [Boudabousia tangfeifanii]AOZ72758.1 hypothetical protein BK816_05165 [Boudabousia tangfeifanii]